MVTAQQVPPLIIEGGLYYLFSLSKLLHLCTDVGTYWYLERWVKSFVIFEDVELANRNSIGIYQIIQLESTSTMLGGIPKHTTTTDM